MELHIPHGPEQLLLYRLGPPRSPEDERRERRYVAVCAHGETLHSVEEESDLLAIAAMRTALPRNPLLCDEGTLWDAARAARMPTAAPGEIQRLELAMQSAFDDYEPWRFCRVPFRRFCDFLLHTSVIAGEHAWNDPRLARRFFRLTAETVRGRREAFSLFVRAEPDPAIVLCTEEATAIDRRPKFTVRFDAPTPSTGALLRTCFAMDRIAIPGRGREERGVSPTDLSLLTAAVHALTNWLVRRPPRASSDNVSVELEEHPASRLANLDATARPA